MRNTIAPFVLALVCAFPLSVSAQEPLAATRPTLPISLQAKALLAAAAVAPSAAQDPAAAAGQRSTRPARSKRKTVLIGLASGAIGGMFTGASLESLMCSEGCANGGAITLGFTGAGAAVGAAAGWVVATLR